MLYIAPNKGKRAKTLKARTSDQGLSVEPLEPKDNFKYKRGMFNPRKSISYWPDRTFMVNGPHGHVYDLDLKGS